jgi:hypothetical protein
MRLVSFADREKSLTDFRSQVTKHKFFWLLGTKKTTTVKEQTNRSVKKEKELGKCLATLHA